MKKNTQHNVIQGMFNETTKEKIANEKFDIIIISHVLEHVNEPKNFLLNAMGSLNKNGLIYIEVPSIQNIGLSNDHLMDYFHVAHPWSFTKNNLLKVCSELNLVPIYSDNVIRVILKKGFNSRRYYCNSLFVYISLIYQDILSRLGLLGFKRKITKNDRIINAKKNQEIFKRL